MCDDLNLIDDFSGVLKCSDDVLAAQFRIAGHDLFNGISAGNHTQEVPHHDPRAADHGFPGANGWIDSIRFTASIVLDHHSLASS